MNKGQLLVKFPITARKPLFGEGEPLKKHSPKSENSGEMHFLQK